MYYICTIRKNKEAIWICKKCILYIPREWIGRKSICLENEHVEKACIPRAWTCRKRTPRERRLSLYHTATCPPNTVHFFSSTTRVSFSEGSKPKPKIYTY